VGDNIDVLQEWKWNQGNFRSLAELIKGLEKDIAQKQFIKEAEGMGIPRVKWETSSDSTDLIPREVWGLSVKDSIIEPGCPVGRKLNSRSEIPTSSTVPGNECQAKLFDNTQSFIWNGLILLSRFAISLWTTLPLAKSGSVEEGKSKRLHARAWKET
jgi:hypothetical protein